MEYRRVQLVSYMAGNSKGKGGKGTEVDSSTFNFEGRTYVLTGSKRLSVPLYVANAWVTADSNVQILPER